MYDVCLFVWYSLLFHIPVFIFIGVKIPFEFEFINADNIHYNCNEPGGHDTKWKHKSDDS